MNDFHSHFFPLFFFLLTIFLSNCWKWHMDEYNENEESTEQSAYWRVPTMWTTNAEKKPKKSSKCVFQLISTFWDLSSSSLIQLNRKWTFVTSACLSPLVQFWLFYTHITQCDDCFSFSLIGFFIILSHFLVCYWFINFDSALWLLLNFIVEITAYTRTEYTILYNAQDTVIQ